MPNDATEVKAVTSRLVDLSGRMLRFEPVDPAELREFEAARDALLAEVADEMAGRGSTADRTEDEEANHG